MFAFVGGLLLLLGGYVVYGRLTESAIVPEPDRPTPAYALADGVDFVAMSTWRVYLVQLLNIAGLGPVFGPILGALWGPQVYLWIVLGCILGGAVHDFLVGAMSIRHDGAGLPDLIGHYLGAAAKHVSTFFILLLMLLVGTVFVKGPALLLVELLPAETVGSWFGPAATTWLETSYFGTSAWLWLVMAGGVHLLSCWPRCCRSTRLSAAFIPFLPWRCWSWSPGWAWRCSPARFRCRRSR